MLRRGERTEHGRDHVAGPDGGWRKYDVARLGVLERCRYRRGLRGAGQLADKLLRGGRRRVGVGDVVGVAWLAGGDKKRLQGIELGARSGG